MDYYININKIIFITHLSLDKLTWCFINEIDFLAVSGCFLEISTKTAHHDQIFNFFDKYSSSQLPHPFYHVYCFCHCQFCIMYDFYDSHSFYKFHPFNYLIPCIILSLWSVLHQGGSLWIRKEIDRKSDNRNP